MKAFYLALAAFLLVPSTNVYAESYTYDFTGAVTSVSGSFGSLQVGSSVDGTFSIDFSVANPAQNTGTIGQMNGYWLQNSQGGSLDSSNPPTAYIFSSTLEGAGYSYGPPTPASYFTRSYVLGCAAGCPESPYWEGAVQVASNVVPISDASSQVFFFGNGPSVFSSNGLPSLGNVQNYGIIAIDYGSTTETLQYNITSMHLVGAVPEPSTYALLLAGLGMIGFMARVRAASMAA